MGKDVIIALDFESAKRTYEFLDMFSGRKPYVKIGMELFYAEGPDIVRAIKARGHNVFLDLKLHDIPNTVMKAARVLSGLGADMVNMHASGTSEMMRAAVSAFDGMINKPVLLAVTQLTSTSEERMRDELLINSTMAETVAHYALNAKRSGCAGVVCSPIEAELVKSACGTGFLTVTPGIRFADSAKDDQSRVMTPEKARRFSDYIVVGRPVTAAGDPVAAYERCVREFVG